MVSILTYLDPHDLVSYMQYLKHKFTSMQFRFVPSYLHRPEGVVSYEVHSSTTGPLSAVNQLVSQREEEEFIGTWMVVAEWKEVPPFGSSAETKDKVCIMERGLLCGIKILLL